MTLQICFLNRATVQLCYQSVKPSYYSHLTSTNTEEASCFSQMYTNDENSKVEIMASINATLRTNSLRAASTTNWTIGPNPCSGILHLNNLPNNTELSYIIFTLDGKIVEQKSSAHQQITLQHLPKGYYIIKTFNSIYDKTFTVLYQ